MKIQVLIIYKQMSKAEYRDGIKSREEKIGMPCTHSRVIYRAGAIGTAGTAMAVPVCEGKIWRYWDSNVRTHSLPQLFIVASNVQAVLRGFERLMPQREDSQHSGTGDETNTCGMGMRPTRANFQRQSDGNLQARRCS